MGILRKQQRTCEALAAAVAEDRETAIDACGHFAVAAGKKLGSPGGLVACFLGGVVVGSLVARHCAGVRAAKDAATAVAAGAVAQKRPASSRAVNFIRLVTGV